MGRARREAVSRALSGVNVRMLERTSDRVDRSESARVVRLLTVISCTSGEEGDMRLPAARTLNQPLSPALS